MRSRETNFDGLVGPTHNYAGLSHGNVASTSNRGQVSNPRAAALEGIAKMQRLIALGLPQAVLPPQARPDPDVLRGLGYSGTDASVLNAVPDVLLARAASASSMWTANAATVAPSVDTKDGRVHLVPANLQAKFHRALEASQTTRTLRAIFADPQHFEVHEALPAHPDWADEGAANQTRLAPDHGAPGVHLFAWGRSERAALGPSRFPARQTLEASQAVARLLHLPDDRVVFAQNTPRAIDAGVFHNDVIAVGNTSVLLLHEHAFVEQAALLAELRRLIPGFVAIEIPDDACSLADAVSTYLFNSQLLSLPDGRVVLLAPSEVRANSRVSALLGTLVGDGRTLGELVVQDLRQSMRNGGGPACLRLRVVLTDAESAALSGRVRVWDGPEPEVPDGHVAVATLVSWVERHYRDRLAIDDLRDPGFLTETRTALDELTQLLGLGSIYPFQQ